MPDCGLPQRIPHCWLVSLPFRRGNTGTIVESMDELEGVQISAEHLRQDLMGVNADLQVSAEKVVYITSLVFRSTKQLDTSQYLEHGSSCTG